MASCSYVKNCSEADMTEDEWETLRLDSTDGGLPFHTLMIRPLCAVFVGLFGLNLCTKTVLKPKCCCLKTYSRFEALATVL